MIIILISLLSYLNTNARMWFFFPFPEFPHTHTVQKFHFPSMGPTAGYTYSQYLSEEMMWLKAEIKVGEHFSNGCIKSITLKMYAAPKRQRKVLWVSRHQLGWIQWECVDGLMWKMTLLQPLLKMLRRLWAIGKTWFMLPSRKVPVEMSIITPWTEGRNFGHWYVLRLNYMDRWEENVVAIFEQKSILLHGTFPNGFYFWCVFIIPLLPSWTVAVLMLTFPQQIFHLFAFQTFPWVTSNFTPSLKYWSLRSFSQSDTEVLSPVQNYCKKPSARVKETHI